MEEKTVKKNHLIGFFDRIFSMNESRANYFGKVTIVDKILAATFLPLISKRITPNRITLFRFATIPVIIALLLSTHYASGAILFIISAFSDALDGALARTTKHVTNWGILADPLADKLLIGSTALILVTHFIGRKLALSIVIIELVIIATSYFRYKGKVVPAKTVGKIKMILQSVGLAILLLHAVFGAPLLLVVATYTLYLAVAFALLSLLIYKSV